MKKLRIGIIGTGFGARIQAPGFMMHPNCEVVALSGVSRPGRAVEQATLLGIPQAYDDYQQMLAQEELDLVSVVSAPHLHHPMTIAALERQIPVFCEKPMAMNLAEAQAMVDAAERRNLTNAIDFEFRHLPVRARFKEMVAEGFLGELMHFTLTFTMDAYQRHLERPMSWLWRGETGGGMLGALGSHQIDMLRWCFGDFQSVCGNLTTYIEQREGERVTADDSFSFMVKMASKATGAVQCLLHAHHGFGLRLEAFGTKGTLVLVDRTLLAGKPGEPMQEVALPARFDVVGVTYPEQLDPHVAPFVVLVDHLVHRLRGEEPTGANPSYATFRDGVAVQAVLDAIRRSHQEGRWVDVAKV